jgi:3,4-dihydroxy 2-butanone 4-phosphate synthase/GTP cyclohydrolase II
MHGEPVEISCAESKQMTHDLRATHDAILVGVNTIINDDPKLTARLSGEKNPQPLVLDSRLRIPLTARLLKNPVMPLWVAATDPDPTHATHLETLGAKIIRCEPDSQGRVNLTSLLDQLGALGIKKLMVEGGAQVIQSFLTQGLAQKLIITVAPRLIGGVKAVGALPSAVTPSNVRYRQLGIDLIVEAEL